MKKSIAFAAAFLSFAACDNATAPGAGGRVAVRFGTGTTSHVSGNRISLGDPAVSSDELTLTGTNGTVVIQDIRFIVAQMKLRSSDESSTCSDDQDESEIETDDVRVSWSDREGNEASGAEAENEDDDDCEFKGGPFIVDLPLDGNTTVSTENVPAGTYDSFRFKIDDLEAGNDDEDDDRAAAPALLTELRKAYPDFPARASMVVKGTQDGKPFTVYFRSKLHIFDSIDPPLVVPGSPALTVKIDPSLWFKNGAQVIDLVSMNGMLVDFGNDFRKALKGFGHDDD